jgi:hypothetical protein
MDNEHFCLPVRFASNLRVTQESEILCGSLSASCACRQVWHLIEVFGGEIGRIELVLEVGHKRRIDVTDGRPVNSVKEGSMSNRFSAPVSNLEATIVISRVICPNRREDPPSDQIFCFTAQPDIIREMQVVLPLDNLLVCLMRVLGTEWRVSCRGSCVSQNVKGVGDHTYRQDIHT